MTEELGKNKTIRGAFRGHCTKDLKKAEQIMEENPADIQDLTALKERLERRTAELHELDNTIIRAHSNTADIEREVEDALTWSDKILNCQSAIGRFLAQRSDAKPVSPFQSNRSASFNYSKELSSNHKVAVRLPKLALKTFSGDILEWLTFWDGFSSAVDSNMELSNVDKMNYLGGFLKGEAARVIAGLPLSEGNYQTAVQLLKERYGKKQTLINAYMDALSKIPPTSDDVINLRGFYDTYEKYIRGLEALGTQTNTYGNLLLPIIIKKLPAEIRRIIFRTNPLADSSLDELRSSLLREIETREKSEPSTSDLDDALPSTSGINHIPTAAALLSRTENKADRYNRKPRNCTYCDGTHRSENCDKVVSNEERLSILRRKKRCFNCLAENHMTRKCFSKGRCRNCGNKHHTSICRSSRESQRNAATKDNEILDTVNERKPEPTRVGTTQVWRTKTPILSQTAEVTVIGDGKRCSGLLLFDTGSQRTFISQRLRDKLQLKTTARELLDVATFESEYTDRKEYEVVNLKLVTNEQADVNLTALVTPTICPAMKIDTVKIEHPKLEGMKLAAPHKYSDNHNIDILIGNDHYGELITGEMVKCDNDGLIAMNSKFGWLLSGPIPEEGHRQGITTCCRIEASLKESGSPELLLPKLWETYDIQEPMSGNTDSEVHSQFKETITFNKGTKRYAVRLPWKDNKHDLPSNLAITKRRLYNLHTSLTKRDPTLIKRYTNYIEEQLSQGFIEKVPEPKIHDGILHYIPHFPVFKSDSATTKMRVVYDASARSSSKALSLNDCLYTGPNLMRDLLTILLRFRIHKIAFTADIEKAFLQIELNQEDRDATRFLWFKDPDQPTNFPQNTQVYRFCRVLFGAAPSPFLLGATIGFHLDSKKGSKVAADLKESMYMDNVVTGTDTTDNAMEYYTKSRLFLKEAGMNLRQWTTNSPQLTRKSNEDNVNATRTVKVLGLTWDSEKDTLSLSLDKLVAAIAANTSRTKRTMLSLTSMLFDPLGLAEPVTIKAKIMLQELWKISTSWDDQLPNEHEERWSKWLSEVKNLTSIEIPRRYMSLNEMCNTGLQLHVFCDSSQLAYGAVAYLKLGRNTTWVMAKSRVAPIKSQSLPRLELQAALLGAELSEYIRSTFKDRLITCQTILWTDSQIVLAWLASKKRLQQFVESRVKKIKGITIDTWKYCPTSDNPADLLTRGISCEHFSNKLSTWLKGPVWLKESAEMWPNKRPTQATELKTRETPVATISATEAPTILNIIDLERFSTLDRAIRVTAYVHRFIARCKKASSTCNMPSAEERIDAEITLIKGVQQKAFADVIRHLKEEPINKKTPSIVNQLGLFLDKHQITRCRGRLGNSPLAEETKFPILLPPQSRLAELIVWKTHSTVLHNGVRDTLTELRQRFWIPKGRQLVKRLIKKCVTCKRVEGKPYRSVIAPPLPKLRLHDQYAFYATGVDYAGPLYTISKSQGTKKAYVCLFTCASTRALHLELVEDLSAESFIRALRRFISRRGTPHLIVSDNAKNFKATSAVLETENILESDKCQQYLANRTIRWQFIAERAPWWGGFYERLVGLIKRCLKKTIGKACLSMVELNTVLTEVEAVLNSRPLTYTYTDISDGSPLTPSHFLCGHRLLTLPQANPSEMDTDPDFVPGGSTKGELSRKLRHQEKLSVQFWCQWRKEYLTGLREYHNARKAKLKQASIIKGDVVLIHDDLPRCQWKLAVVDEILPGRDGKVRSSRLRTSNRKSLVRPIEKLYPLEMHEELKTAEDTEKEEQVHDGRPPRRAAAKEAGIKIKELYLED